MLEVVRAVFQVPNVRRVAGKPGAVGRVAVEKFGVEFDMYIDQLGLPGYWPTSLVVAVSHTVRLLVRSGPVADGRV